MYEYIYIYIYVFIHTHTLYIHIYIYIEREREGFFLRATRFAGSPARSGASCSGQGGGGNYTLVCARPPCGKYERLLRDRQTKTGELAKISRMFTSTKR